MTRDCRFPDWLLDMRQRVSGSDETITCFSHSKTTNNPSPQLSLPNIQISELFRQRTPQSSNSLADLITSQTNLDDLDRVVVPIIQQLLLSSAAQRTQIDELVSFLAFTANCIHLSASHPGQPTNAHYKSTVLRPSRGVNIISERLSHTLHERLWCHISCAVTPDEDVDKDIPNTYYIDTSILATVLARAFSTQSTLHVSLWREIEDILVKGLFSGSDQEPGTFITLAAVLLGAGAEIRAYLNDGNVGYGRNWVWYDNVRSNEQVWGWSDIVSSLQKEPEPGLASRLPGFVRTSFEFCKQHVGEGNGEMKSWDSLILAREAFGWIEQ